MRSRVVEEFLIWICVGIAMIAAYLVISQVGPVLNSLTGHLIGQ